MPLNELNDHLCFRPWGQPSFHDPRPNFHPRRSHCSRLPGNMYPIRLRLLSCRRHHSTPTPDNNDHHPNNHKRRDPSRCANTHRSSTETWCVSSRGLISRVGQLSLPSQFIMVADPRHRNCGNSFIRDRRIHIRLSSKQGKVSSYQSEGGRGRGREKGERPR